MSGNAYSVGLAAYFEEPFKAGGGTIVGEQKYNGGDKDFKAQLTTVKGENPDVLVVPGYYSEAGLIAQQARQLGITIPIVGRRRLGSAGVDRDRQGSHGQHLFLHALLLGKSIAPLFNSFVKNFMAKNGGEVPDAEAACGYDSAMVLLTRHPERWHDRWREIARRDRRHERLRRRLGQDDDQTRRARRHQIRRDHHRGKRQVQIPQDSQSLSLLL